MNKQTKGVTKILLSAMTPIDLPVFLWQGMADLLNAWLKVGVFVAPIKSTH